MSTVKQKDNQFCDLLHETVHAPLRSHPDNRFFVIYISICKFSVITDLQIYKESIFSDNSSPDPEGEILIPEY